jgi:glyoxylase-like metal-dependent hydrolase (beta-lactamase superfamily II)
LLWPAGEKPSVNNTLLADPCFTMPGLASALKQLNQLGLSLMEIGRIFVTHRHGDHLLNLSTGRDIPEFTDHQVGQDGPLAGISIVPCPGHEEDLQALVFRSAAKPSERVWIVGDAVLDLEWLKAWGYFWPNRYSPAEIVQTWRSVAKILAGADLVIPGHGPPISITPPLIKELLATFDTAEFSGRCQDVKQILADRLEQ